MAGILLTARYSLNLCKRDWPKLAELAGVGKNMVYELESVRQGARLENLLKVLQVLNIELDFQSPRREAFLKEPCGEAGSVQSPLDGD